MGGRFAIAVKDLAVGGSDFVFPLTVDWLKNSLSGCEVEPAGADGVFEVRAAPSGSDVLVQGSIRVALQAACVRCLEPARVDVAAAFSVLMTPASRIQATAREADEDVDRETFDGDEIVLDGLAREHILLEVPMSPLCSEACTGTALEAKLPHRPDPRLAPLAGLLNRGDQGAKKV